MLKKIVFDDAKDKNVANYVAFGDSSDHKLYYSEGEGKVQVSQADLNDAFLKGRLLICTNSADGVYEVAVKVAANKVSTMGTASSAVAFVEWTALAPAANEAKKSNKK